MQLLYVIGTGVLAAFCVLLAVRICYQRRYIRTSDRINDCIFRNVAAYLLLIDPDFNVLQTNYRSATGTAPKAVPPKVGNLLRCRNGEDAGVCGTHELCADCPVRAAITGVFRTKKGFSGLEVPMVLYTSDDRTATVDCDVSVAGNFLTVAGQPRVVLTVSDISAQKRTQRELEKARVRAEESDRMKSLFLANMSHEIRTPLNAIVGFSSLMQNEQLSQEERAEYCAIVVNNSEMLLTLLNDILDISSLECGKIRFNYASEDIVQICQHVMMTTAHTRQRGVEGRFACPVGSFMLATDTHRLSQILINLLTNAGKFTSEGSITLGGEDITFAPEYQRSRVIGHLFQDPLKGTAPNMTIEENLALAYTRAHSSGLALALSRKKSNFFREQVSRFNMGLEDRMKTKIGLLSGGQRQVVTLLMCTICTPKLLLLDEHTAALDPVTAKKVMDITNEIVAENNITTICPLHWPPATAPL